MTITNSCHFKNLLGCIFVPGLIVGKGRAVVEGVSGVIQLEVLLLLGLGQTAVLDRVVHGDSL